MRLIQNFRNYFFWLSDFIKGNPIKTYFIDVSNTFKNPLNQSNDKNLSKILRHAIQTTEFYTNLSNDSELKDFPVVNKSIIRESHNSFLSNKYEITEILPVVTSGSTGTPFKTYQDKNKKQRNYADTIYFANLAGFELGHKLVYLKIWAKEKMNSPFQYWLQNMVPVDVIHLNDNQIEKLINRMESNSATYGMLGYASALEQICRYLDKCNSPKIKADVRSIISMSESLNDYTKESLEKYFGTPAVARYSNLENGIIAQQIINGAGRYLVNTASYYVEILQMDNDEPAILGELGRIVVTDLFNYAMPMIRYDTGDVGSFEIDPSHPGLLFLSKVEGRKLDQLYDTKGNLVSSYIMYKNMWKYTEITQYQLIQQGEKEYLFKINTDKDFTRETALVAEFKSFLGDDADFKVKYVDEIPLLASGKRRKVVNNYKS